MLGKSRDHNAGFRLVRQTVRSPSIEHPTITSNIFFLNLTYTKYTAHTEPKEQIGNMILIIKQKYAKIARETPPRPQRRNGFNCKRSLDFRFTAINHRDAPQSAHIYNTSLNQTAIHVFLHGTTLSYQPCSFIILKIFVYIILVMLV